MLIHLVPRQERVAALVWCVNRVLVWVSARKSWRRVAPRETSPLAKFPDGNKRYVAVVRFACVAHHDVRHGLRTDYPFAQEELRWALLNPTTTYILSAPQREVWILTQLHSALCSSGPIRYQTFCNTLSITPEEHPAVLLTEATVNPTVNRKRMTRL